MSADEETRIATLDGQLEVVTPANSLPPEVADMTVEVELKIIDSATVPAPPVDTHFIRSIEVNTLVDGQASAITYAKPVILRIPLTPEELALAGHDPSKLMVFRYNPDTDIWDPVPTTPGSQDQYVQSLRSRDLPARPADTDASSDSHTQSRPSCAARATRCHSDVCTSTDLHCCSHTNGDNRPYTDRRGNAYPDPNNSRGYANNSFYSYCHGHTHYDANADSNLYSYGHTQYNANADSNLYSCGHTQYNANADSNLYSCGHTHYDANADGDASSSTPH